MNIFWKSRSGERGNSLLSVCFVGVALGGMLMYMANMGAVSARSTGLQEDRSQAAAVAEYAASLAIAQLDDMEYTDASRTVIRRDWVQRNLFDATNRDERRFSGSMDGYDYVVRVQSLRDTREHNPTKAEHWLSSLEVPDYEFGKDPATKFSGVYEITAAARSSRHDRDNWTIPDAVVKTVVALGNTAATSGGLAYPAVLSVAFPGGLLATPNIIVSGEDHYGVRTAITSTLQVIAIEEVAKIAAQDSQLFSVTGGRWSYGQLTAQYMRGDDFNPNIPRTTKFSAVAAALAADDDAAHTARAANADHRMFRMDPDREPDLYVFGGKVASSTYSKDLSGNGFNLNYEYGRSVSIDSAGLIRENKQADSEPDGDEHFATALAVGKTEDLARIYLNYTNDTTTPANITSSSYTSPTASTNYHPTVSTNELQNKTLSASEQNALTTWRNRWTQAPILYHTRNAMKSNSIKQDMPLDNASSTAKRRAAVKIWIKNGKGEFLVRDYPYYPQVNRALPFEKWDGYYTWAPYGGYIVSDTAGGTATYSTKYVANAAGTSVSTQTVPTSDPHRGQTYYLVGGKTHIGWPEKRYYTTSASVRSYYQRGMHTRFLTIQELTGYKVTLGSDNLPAKLADPNNPASIIGGVPDFVLDSNGEKIPYRVGPGLATQFDEAAQRANTADNYAANPGVTFGVTETPPPLDGIYVHEKNDDGTYVMVEDPDTHLMVKKVTRYQTMEDFAYEQNIAPPGEPEDIRKVVTFHMVLENTLMPSSETVNSSDRLYFDMGMTVSLVSPKVIETDNAKDVDKNWDFQWWEGSSESSLSGNVSHYSLSYNLPDWISEITDPAEKLRAIYELMGMGNPPDLALAANIYTMLDKNGNKMTFPRALFILNEQNGDGTPNPDFGLLDEHRILVSDTYYYSKDDVQFFVNMYKYTQAELDAKNEAELEADAVAMMKSKNLAKFGPLTFLPIASRFANVPDAVKAGISDDPDDLSAAIEPKIFIAARGVASELFGYQTKQIPAAYMRNGGSDRVIRRDFYGDYDANKNDPVEPLTVRAGFLPGEYNQLTGQTATLENTPAPDDHIPLPAWNGKHQPDGTPMEARFIWKNDGGTDTYKAAIREVPEINGITHAAILHKLSDRDTRGGLGWHRAGPNAEADSMLQDHYEYVVMGERGFQPFKEVVDGSNTLVAYTSLASDYDPTDPTQVLTPNYNFAVQSKPTSEMPTFVIGNAPLDGAGILVVNGNLEIRTTFAYSGILIVLGDLKVIPTKQSTMRRDEDDHPLNADGRVLYWNSKESYYYYIDPETGEMLKSNPAYDEKYVGRLVVQGRVLVGGQASAQQDGDGMGVFGEMDLRGSQEALDTVIGEFLDKKGGFKVNQLNWSGGEGLDARALWANTVE